MYLLKKVFYLRISTEQTYTFTVRTINNAVESIRVSGPSQAVSCQIKSKGKTSIFFCRFNFLNYIYTSKLL